MKILQHRPISLSGWPLVLPFFVSAATGFSEEFVYRGYFADRLSAVFDNFILANCMQTLLFVLIHVPITFFVLHYSLQDSLLYAGQIAVLGFIYGIVFVQTESILPSAIAHSLWNFSNALFR
jgi:membrane protease YdiL (CAAX protease family)